MYQGLNRADEEYWIAGLDHLRAYFTEHKHSLVPQKYDCKDGFSLGSWVASQRMRRKDGRMPPEQISLLERLDFVWDCRKNAWEEGYRHLRDYVRKHGTAQVPKKYKSSDGFLLGVWMRRQRQRKDKPRGNQQQLTEYQVRKLDKIGMVWVNPDKGGRKKRCQKT